MDTSLGPGFSTVAGPRAQKPAAAGRGGPVCTLLPVWLPTWGSSVRLAAAGLRWPPRGARQQEPDAEAGNGRALACPTPLLAAALLP